MKAAVCIKHGKPGSVEIRKIPKPIPKDGEILIQIIATTVTAGDVVLRRQSFLKYILFWPIARIFFGIKNQRKKILGHEFSGIVESVGRGVSRFRKGDEVCGTTGFRGGAHAEYLALPDTAILVCKPANLSFEEAAALPIGGTCSLDFLKQANIQSGDEILIYGASGSIGTYAVQLAKYFGARVTGVSSTRNIDLIKSVGADAVVDYKKQDVSSLDEKFDIVFDAVGKVSKTRARRLLRKNGCYISTHSSPVKEKQEYLDLISDLASKGEIRPVIDKNYTLDKIRDAHTYVESGRKRGNVVVCFHE